MITEGLLESLAPTSPRMVCRVEEKLDA